MKSLAEHFESLMRDQIHESKWFKTAPKKLQQSAVIRFLGVEIRTRHTLMNGSFERACLIAECECGEETQRFALSLESGESAYMIDTNYA